MNTAPDNHEFNATPAPVAGELPDPETCRRARLSRDPRFDGEFFLAVSTTGIYCRPVCPARPPAEKNVSYFREAAQAAQAGFRPCLRCRPEAAPGSAAWAGTGNTVRRALSLIHAGALNDGSVGELADRLGVGERYLRKLFERDLGVSPLDVALNRRLLFAKQLLAESDLPMTEVAFAAGFGSLRRFNSAVLDSFGMPPSRLRRRKAVTHPGPIRLQLQYRPPYDWEGVINFFGRHAIEGVESVTANRYQRRVEWGGKPATLTVSPVKGRHALALDIETEVTADLLTMVSRVRRMFDLDANPDVIAQVLGAWPALAALLQRFPGIRAPVHWSVEEACVRAIVGQQVSVDAARTVCAGIAGALPDNAFPDPAAIARLAEGHLPMPNSRRLALKAACEMLGSTPDGQRLEALAGIRGIGPWTTSMVAMRGLGDPDAWPAKDLGLLRAWDALGGETSLETAASEWRPFRTYAANLLWRSL
ncbi:DNA-3-methyladenine glycosylase 2 family protein [Marinihelvus fidelis]|uniref:DNA-3-methyladenine glycosylase II n=1 Tax=Marinihelvus fidelis TaxID=2613842 RepID=A0A5N0T5S3_9GAMM|nr:AlkA N-terminal domain-containing protein [Marinihelvus fidelis]KAA9130171.1 DNA-3-methyladenine glycosylase 2 family protein [Marinihelvus fidelis]